MCLDAKGGTPVERAANVMEAVLEGNPRAETEAPILADAVLAQSNCQTRILLLQALSLKPHDLRLRGEDLRLACYRAVVSGVGSAVPVAADMVRAAVRLRAESPRLRAKGAEKAVEMFLCAGRAGAGDAGVHVRPRGTAAVRTAGGFGCDSRTDRARDVPALRSLTMERQEQRLFLTRK